MEQRLIIGAMSGTSADGVDAALVRVSGRGLSMTCSVLRHVHREYPAELKRAIIDLRTRKSAEVAELANLARQVSLAYADAVRDVLIAADVSAEQVAAIAAHGQTLYHQPPLTLQWIDPALLAYETNVAVVSDFRRADCAAGGQGAPLVPFADYLLFRVAKRDRVLLNIGGIANLTFLRAGGTIDEVIAFDTGPGNCISDFVCLTHSKSSVGFDAGGATARRGKMIPTLRDAYLADPYFRLSPPKSTDTAAMLAPFDGSLTRRNTTEDVLATAAYLTARTIADAISTLGIRSEFELIVSGGGVHNAAMMEQLRIAIGDRATVRTIDELGVASDAKEAVAFALLGAATLDGLPGNVPSVTGATRGVVLGCLTPRP